MKCKKFASIDVGSNAVRLLFTGVFETSEGPVFRKISLIRVPIRLGEDAFTLGRISEDKADHLVRAMLSFKYLMDVHNVLDYKAYATSAMREATNSKHIISEIKYQTDLDLEIVSGNKEADTISFENLPSYIPQFENAMFVDVGGGSTELTCLKDRKKKAAKSLKIGTIRLLHKTVDDSLWEEMQSWFEDLEIADMKVPIIGTGGNINKILKMIRKQQGDYFITPSDLSALKMELESMSYEDRITKYVLNPDRADVIIPAAQIFETVTNLLDSDKIYIPKVRLSDGIARSLYQKYKNKN